MDILLDWRLAWVLPSGRWDSDGVSLLAEALATGDWGTVEEFAATVGWPQNSAS